MYDVTQKRHDVCMVELEVVDVSSVKRLVYQFDDRCAVCCLLSAVGGDQQTDDGTTRLRRGEESTNGDQGPCDLSAASGTIATS